MTTRCSTRGSICLFDLFGYNASNDFLLAGDVLDESSLSSRISTDPNSLVIMSNISNSLYRMKRKHVGDHGNCYTVSKACTLKWLTLRLSNPLYLLLLNITMQLPLSSGSICNITSFLYPYYMMCISIQYLVFICTTTQLTG